MTRPTRANPAGVRPFDHGALAHLPAYHKACKALDDLAHALDVEDIELGQAAWLRMAEQMAASLPFADCCRACIDGNRDYGPRYPHRAEISGGRLVGSYRCLECGDRWTCNWALDAPRMAP